MAEMKLFKFNSVITLMDRSIFLRGISLMKVLARNFLFVNLQEVNVYTFFVHFLSIVCATLEQRLSIISCNFRLA